MIGYKNYIPMKEDFIGYRIFINKPLFVSPKYFSMLVKTMELIIMKILYTLIFAQNYLAPYYMSLFPSFYYYNLRISHWSVCWSRRHNSANKLTDDVINFSFTCDLASLWQKFSFRVKLVTGSGCELITQWPNMRKRVIILNNIMKIIFTLIRRNWSKHN